MRFPISQSLSWRFHNRFLTLSISLTRKLGEMNITMSISISISISRSVSTFAYIYIHTMSMYVYIYIYMNVYIYIHTHIYIYIYTWRNLREWDEFMVMSKNHVMGIWDYTTNLRILMMVGFGGIVHKKGRFLVCELFWLMVINGD